MITVCDINKCTGCMVCVDTCNKGAITVEDSLTAYNAYMDLNKCIHCGACQKICPQNNHSESCTTKEWFQGWTKNVDIRSNSSSGGLATELTKAFLNSGGVVAGCVFTSGEFKFDIIDDVSKITLFQGSKYVKSNPRGIYKRINHELRKGRKTLFIGLPCQVAAIKKYCQNNKLLYTIDLICHGTPSPKLLEMYHNQHDSSLKEIHDIRFRDKTKFYLSYTDKQNASIMHGSTRDGYTIAFLNGISYTDNCYSCQYANLNRISDITLGDSWASDLSREEIQKGISLIMVQTDKGKELLSMSELDLYYVNVENAINNNHQLVAPSVKPTKRIEFFDSVRAGTDIDKIIKDLYPKQWYKQRAKGILIEISNIFKRQ